MPLLRILKLTFLFFTGLLSNINLFAQQGSDFIQRDESRIYKIEKELILGNKKALLDMVPYFDSKNKMTVFLGYHVINTTESVVAKGILEENCIFLDSEVSFSDNTTANEFKVFLDQNLDQISFSNYAEAFFLTPLEKRTVKFEIREISKAKKQELILKKDSLLNLNWVKSNKINLLIKEKNPKALLLIASELYKVRYRFDKKFPDQVEYIDLIRLLTGTEIATEDEKNHLTWFIEKEFYPKASLNLLIYFLNNYKYYKWNDKKTIFENKKTSVNQLDKETLLFELLSNKNDSIAEYAFKQLTNCNVENVVNIASEYEKSDIKVNYSLPTFPFRFLKQLVLLTDYCKSNNIDLESSPELKMNIELLKTKLTFKDRRKFENKLIENLTLDQITAFEYQCLLDEKDWELTHSAGRILDVFYSKNWNELLNNKEYLKLYIKKTLFFQRLGIIGICNNYLRKFENSNDYTIIQLNKLEKTDPGINQQREYVKNNYTIPYIKPEILKKEFEGNKDFLIFDLEGNFSNIKNDTIEKYEDKVIDLLSKINYNQIGKALELIENVKFKTKWKYKYSFLKDDFGFFWIKNFDDLNERLEFIKMYTKYSEYDFYSYYLNQSGIDYLNEDNSLNYDKIYELLKYDVATAFVGGGGGIRNNEVYALIKLLEIQYKTTLGYPKKLCNSSRIYACSSKDRATEWMQFIKDKNLLKVEHNEPNSFNFR